MPSANSAGSILEKEKRIRKLKLQLVVMILCHFIWGVVHLVHDLMNNGVVFPHVFFSTIGGLCYYAGKLNKVDIRLLKLRRKIDAFPLLVRRKLAVRDYVGFVVTGMWLALGVCGVVEFIDLAFGVHGAGSGCFPPSVTQFD